VADKQPSGCIVAGLRISSILGASWHSAWVAFPTSTVIAIGKESFRFAFYLSGAGFTDPVRDRALLPNARLALHGER
jgi:hypothetical protein